MQLPLLQKASGQQRGLPSGKIHFQAVARRENLCVLLLHAQHLGKAPGSAEAQKSVPVLLLPNTLLYRTGISSVLVTQSKKWDRENC